MIIHMNDVFFTYFTFHCLIYFTFRVLLHANKKNERWIMYLKIKMI